MQNFFGRCVIACGLAGIISVAAIATEVEEMSLESLLDMKVSVASKKSETISEAPGIISVITAEDIARMPFTTLYDILATVPGVSITESYFGYTDVSFRGIKETNYNNRTLLLLNGTPIRDTTVGTYWLEAIPVNVIDRIEIIRGPGSVIYGTNAFTGVINVITKSKANVTDVTAKGGTNSLAEGRATFGRSNDTINYLVGAQYHNSNGFNAQVKDENGITQQMGAYADNKNAYQDNFVNFFGNVGVKDFALDVYSFDQHKDKFGITPQHLTTGEAITKANGVAGRFNKSISGVEVNAQGYYDQTSFYAPLLHFPVAGGINPPPTGPKLIQEYSGSKYGLNADARVGLSDKVSVLAGAAYEMQKSDPYRFVDDLTNLSSPFSSFLKSYDTYDTSGFAQLEVAPISALKVLAGVRYNNNKDYGSTSVPRVSAVYKAADKLFIKAFYVSAYRNPTFFEKYVTTRNVLYGNPSLKPEKINTSEVGLDWIVKNTGIRFSVYNEITEAMIGRFVTWGIGSLPPVILLEADQRGGAAGLQPTANTPGYDNGKGLNINGAELEVRGEIIGKLLGYNVNASYKTGTDKQLDKDIPFLDQQVANVMLTNSVGNFRNNLVVNWVGERKGNIDANDPAATQTATGLTAGQAVTVPAYTLVNLKSTYSINKSFDVALSILNIFEQTVLYPEYIRSRILGVPGDSQREIYGEVTYRF